MVLMRVRVDLCIGFIGLRVKGFSFFLCRILKEGLNPWLIRSRLYWFSGLLG